MRDRKRRIRCSGGFFNEMRIQLSGEKHDQYGVAGFFNEVTSKLRFQP
jgi:hypothetical protein